MYYVYLIKKPKIAFKILPIYYALVSKYIVLFFNIIVRSKVLQTQRIGMHFITYVPDIPSCSQGKSHRFYDLRTES